MELPKSEAKAEGSGEKKLGPNFHMEDRGGHD